MGGTVKLMAALLWPQQGLTCIVHQVSVLRVGDNQGDQVCLCDVVLAQDLQSLPRLGVIVSQEALQVLQAGCSRGRRLASAESCALPTARGHRARQQQTSGTLSP